MTDLSNSMRIDQTIEGFITSLKADFDENIVAASHGAITTRGKGYVRKSFVDRPLDAVILEMDCLEFLRQRNVRTLEFFPTKDAAFFSEESMGPSIVGYKSKIIEGVPPVHVDVDILVQVVSSVVHGMAEFLETEAYTSNPFKPPVLNMHTRAHACLNCIAELKLDITLNKEVKSALLRVANAQCQKKLVHGDLSLRNLIKDEQNGKISVIDFSDMAFAPLEYELGRLSMTLLASGFAQTFIAGLLEGVRDAGINFDLERICDYAIYHKSILAVVLESETLRCSELITILDCFDELKLQNGNSILNP